MKQNISLLSYERGDQITAADVSSVIADAFNNINFLTHEDVGTLSTGQFFGQADSEITGLLFPNYCGKMEQGNTAMTYFDLGLLRVYYMTQSVLDIIGG